MRNNERQFFIYEVTIEATKAGALMPQMLKLAEIWKRRADDKTAVLDIRKEEAGLVVGDCEIDQAEMVASLLIRLSDKSAANAVYSDLVAGTFTEHAKSATQGGDVGGHLFISLAPEARKPNTYTCLIEGVPNLRPSLMRQILNATLKKEYGANNKAFEYENQAGQKDREGKVKMETCLPRLSFSGRPSESFARDINTGRLTGISLVRAEEAAPVGGVAYLRKKESELRLSVDRGNLPQNVWADVTQALHRSAAQYPQAKVRFRLPGGGRDVTIKVSSQNAAPLEDIYIASIRLANIFPLLAASSQKVVPHLTGLVKPQLIRSRNV